jgi:hypothetical protein
VISIGFFALPISMLIVDVFNDGMPGSNISTIGKSDAFYGLIMTYPFFLAS